MEKDTDMQGNRGTEMEMEEELTEKKQKKEEWRNTLRKH